MGGILFLSRIYLFCYISRRCCWLFDFQEFYLKIERNTCERMRIFDLEGHVCIGFRNYFLFRFDADLDIFLVDFLYSNLTAILGCDSLSYSNFLAIKWSFWIIDGYDDIIS